MQSEYCAADMVFLGAGLSALAFLQAERLLPLPVVLLDFPADAANILDGDGGILGMVVGGHVLRAVFRRNPEQLHLVVHRESLYFDMLAAQPFVTGQFQVGNRLVRFFPPLSSTLRLDSSGQ